MMQFDKVVLTTDRLTLRPIAPDDAAAMYSLRSNPLVTRYTGLPLWTSIDQATARAERDMAAARAGDCLLLALEQRNRPGMIGSCLLFHLDEPCRRAEVGYELHPASWGNGYMHEALQALLQYGFASMNLNRIEADVDPDNAASVRTLERLGFQFEGRLRERWISDGVKSDTAFYGLLLADWQQRER